MIRTQYSTEDREKILKKWHELRQGGMQIKAAAKEVNVSDSVLYKWMRDKNGHSRSYYRRNGIKEPSYQKIEIPEPQEDSIRLTTTQLCFIINAAKGRTL